MRTTLAAAVTLSGALALAGCGSAATTPAGSTPPAPVVVATSAPPSVGATLPTTGLAARISAAMVKAGSGRSTLTSHGLPSATSLSNDVAFTVVDGKTSNVQGTLTTGGRQVEIVMAGGMSYTKLPPPRPAGSKPWVMGDANIAGALSVATKRARIITGDPLALVDSLEGGMAKVVDSGGGRVHYSVTGAKALGGSDLKVDLTTGAQDLPSHCTLQQSGVSMEIDFRDWGTPVTVTVPPADQVSTLPKG